MDVVDRATRSRMMAGIRGKNTSPELMVRRHLHSAGLRFRLHRRDLPGAPDLVLAKYGVVVFVHGCFWHRHSGCRFATTPATNRQFWLDKLTGNAERDARTRRALRRSGWRVYVIWECEIRKPKRLAALVNAIKTSEVGRAPRLCRRKGRPTSASRGSFQKSARPE